MNENYEELKELFNKIKNMGWVEAHRTGNTGIGKTFEDLLDKKEDNLSLPDFKDIEIKSQRNATNSMITLFTKSPDYPVSVNTFLRENFGSISSEYDNMKILHTTINANNFNNTKQIIYENAYWSFENIQKCLEHKLKYVAIVGADEKFENSKNYFKFTDIMLITGITLDKFLEALENGDVLVDIRIRCL